MKILSAAQIRELDAYTIKNEPITSINLMERASRVFVEWFVEKFPDRKKVVYIFCGSGNNGGDGFAVARLLLGKGYLVKVFSCRIGKHFSSDCQANYSRLIEVPGSTVQNLEKGGEFPNLVSQCLIIDAIFGSGLNRPVQGYWGTLVQFLNVQDATRIAIDIPSGLFADTASKGVIFSAHFTLSFEFPKLTFLFPENGKYAGDWEYRSISLSQKFIQQIETNHFFINSCFVKKLIKHRSKFSHKGSYGHCLLIMGSYGKIGAAILATKACLRTGCGLATVHIPKCGYEIMQISIPEAMISVDPGESYLSRIPELTNYRAIGIGCGLDQQKQSEKAFFELIKTSPIPLVIDADALNILAKNPEWFQLLPKGSILTPHPKEFERLFGKFQNEFDRNQVQIEKAQAFNIYIILKGAHTSVACPNGQCYFNSSGNPGMATAGSGDALTGILTSLLSQGYNSLEACILGVFIHGFAGDLGALKISQEALIASDIILEIGSAFQELKS